MENKKNFEAFKYFVDRILPSVNAEFTKFGCKKTVRRKRNTIREVFLVSDEAYGLLMIENYEGWWRKQYENPGKKKEWRTDKEYQAKYTSSNNGLQEIYAAYFVIWRHFPQYGMSR